MRRLTTLFAILMLCATALFAQAPNKFTYQAVVRNASNQLVTNTLVGIRVSILQNSATGSVLYSETQMLNTNANGLVTMNIGEGTVVYGNFNNIDWSAGTFFLKSEIDPNGGSNYSITSTQQLLSVPYALYANEAGNSFSGDYNDLTNRPQIPQAVGELANDANYITLEQVPAQVNADWDAASGVAEILNKPTIPTVPTNVSAFNNDVPYLTVEQQILSISNDTIFLTGGSFVKLPAGFDGDYNSLTNTPDLNQLTDSVMNIILMIQQQWEAAQQQWQQMQMQMQQQIDSLNEQVSQIPHTENTTWNTSVTNETVCDSLVWHGETYSESGVYLYGWTDVDGTHNIEVLNLTIIHHDTIYLQAEACDSYSWGGTTYTVSGDYQQRLTNKFGCDSIVFLHLTIYNSTQNVYTTDTCESYAWNEQTYTESGTYTYAYTNADGCASVDTLHLTIHYSTHNVDTVTTCEGYTWHDSTYTKSGIYTYAYENDYGCASMDTLKLTVHYGTHNVESLNSCGSYEWHGQTYTESGTYTYAYNNEDGCPSMDTLKVEVVLVDEKSCPLAPCITDADGNMYSTVQIGDQCWMRSNLRTTHYADGTAIPTEIEGSGTTPYYYNYSTSVYALEDRGYLYNWPAIMHSQSSSNTNPSGVQGICPDGWHVPSDSEWIQLTDYVSSQSSFGCDGNNAKYAKSLAWQTDWKPYSESTTCVVSIDLSLNNATGFSAVPAGHYYNRGYVGDRIYAEFWSSTEAWKYTIYDYSTTMERASTMKSYGFSVRCVLDAETHNVENASTCSTYEWHGQTYAESGTYTHAYTNACGLASVDTLHLSVHHGTHNVDTVTACESYTWHDSTYSQSGAYTYVYENEYGCASQDTLYLTVHYGTHNVGTENACGSYEWHGQTYNESGTYTYAYNNEDGCPSTDTLKVVVVLVDEKSCPLAPCVTDVDGNIYSTVQIGGQCWMRSNLRTTHFPDGTSILYGGNDNPWSNTEPYYYEYSNCFTLEQRGYAYNWLAMSHGENGSDTSTIGIQGICPDGWHVPTNEEWTQLTDYISAQNDYICDNNNTYIAKALASNTAYWGNSNGVCPCCPSVNQNENNATGFNAVPAASYTACYRRAGFWSSSFISNKDRYEYRIIQSHEPIVRSLNNWQEDKRTPYAVRCVYDISASGTESEGTHNVEVDTACESYTWHGQTYTQSGTYTYAYTNNNGYASVDTLFLTIYNGTHNTYTESADGSYTWHEQTYTTSGTYTYTYNNENDCPSVDTLHLTVSSVTPIDTLEDGQPCTGTPTVTDHEGNVYNTVQIGTQCWTKENMRCTTSPSTGTTILEVYPNGTSYTGKKAYYVNGNSYNTTSYGLLYNWNAAVDTFNTAYGETSTNSNSSNAVSVTFINHRRGICPQGWHVPSNAEWTQLINYVSSKNQYQCGSTGGSIAKALADTTEWNIYSIPCTMGNDLSANNATGFSALPAGAYFGNFYYFGDAADFWSTTSNYGNSAYYNYLYYDYAGVHQDIGSLYCGISVRCLMDSAIGSDTLCIGTHNVEVDTACESYTWHGQPYTESGAYTYAYTNASGCPSVDTLKLTINQPEAELVEATACESYTWNDTTYTESGDYTQSFTTASGCDSVVTLHLTINHGSHNVYTETAESSYTWYWQTYSESGVYTYAYLNDVGCPSVDTLKLTINQCPHHVETENTCESYNWHGQTYNESGTYTFAYTNDCGLPSVDTLNLTIHHGTHAFITETACDSFPWHGVTYTESGDYVHHYTNSYGCPSTTTLRLTIYEPEYEIIIDTACEYYEWHYAVYTESGTYTYRHHDSNGCLVWDTLYLTINKGTHNVSDTTMCESFTWHGNTLTESNTYLYAYTDEHGCQSMDTLHLTIKHGSYNVFTVTECDSYTWCDSLIDHSSTYYCFYVNEHGCPSADTLHLTIDTSGCGDGHPCPGMPTVTDHEGNVYNTVLIGNQCWTKENMRCTTSPSTGSDLLAGIQSTSASKGARWHSENTSHDPNYGVLYNWCAAVDTFYAAVGVCPEIATEPRQTDTVFYCTFNGHRKGICPQGWHVPSGAEWTQLTTYLFYNGYRCSDCSWPIIGADRVFCVAKSLSAATGWNSGSTPCNDVVGFSALPAGFGTHCYHGVGNWEPCDSDFGESAYFWSATDLEGGADYRKLDYDTDSVRRYEAGDKGRFLSVRCVRNE